MIIIVIRKTKEFRHSQYVFKTSIAVSDIIWALVLCFVAATKFQYYFITPYKLYCNPSSIDKNNYKDDKVKNFDCFLLFLQPSSLYNNVWFFLTTFLFRKISLFVSLVSLVFAAGDRYFAIAFPFKHKKTNTIKIAKVLSVIIWILTAFFTIFISLYYESYGYEYSIIYFLQPLSCKNPIWIFESVFLFFLFALLWIFTILTLKSLYKSYKRSLSLNRVVRNKFLAEKQMSTVLIFMVLAFTFSLSSTLYNHIRFYLCKLDCSELCQDYNIYISLYFLSTNSIWNILIYNFINKKFRLALKALFKKTS